MRDLSPRQRQLLAFIVDQRAATGLSPTIREMCEHFRIRSTNGVAEHLAALVRKGMLSPADGRPRSIVPTQSALAALGLEPVLFEEARAALLDAAAEVASVLSVADPQRFTQHECNALLAICAANERWQQAQLQGASAPRRRGAA